MCWERIVRTPRTLCSGTQNMLIESPEHGTHGSLRPWRRAALRRTTHQELRDTLASVGQDGAGGCLNNFIWVLLMRMSVSLKIYTKYTKYTNIQDK